MDFLTLVSYLSACTFISGVMLVLVLKCVGESKEDGEI